MNDDYDQPEFYRFNEDSLKLVKWVLLRVSSAETILDLGAGSGIIGIELSRVLLPSKLTLVEVQHEYSVHLDSNIKKFLPPCVSSDIRIQSFSSYQASDKFDVIVSNPPYYLPDNGELSSNPNRAIARSFIIDSWKILLQKISVSLTESGTCYVVLKQDSRLFDLIKRESANFDLSIDRNDSETLMFLLFRLHKN